MADASDLLNLASGVAYLGVGGVLLALRPARPGAAAFAWFAIASGVQHVLANLGVIFYETRWGVLLSLLALPFVLLAPTYALLACVRYTGRSSGWAWGAAGVALTGAALLLVRPSSVVLPGGFETPLGLLLFTTPYFVGVALAASFLARDRGPVSAALRTERLLLLAAFLPFLSYTSGLVLSLFPALDRDPASTAVLLGMAALTLLLVATAAVPLAREADRRARVLAAACFVLALLGFAQGALFPVELYLGGTMRLFAAFLLAYALLKYRVFDIDARLKRTLARAIGAGIVVGGFFLVSELAESFIADRTGSALLGVGAAAVLLFVETRVTHAGRRLAERALPRVAENDETYLGARRELVYRVAVESASRDGDLSARDLRILDALARELGIPDPDARRIRGEAAPAP